MWVSMLLAILLSYAGIWANVNKYIFNDAQYVPYTYEPKIISFKDKTLIIYKSKSNELYIKDINTKKLVKIPDSKQVISFNYLILNDNIYISFLERIPPNKHIRVVKLDGNTLSVLDKSIAVSSENYLPISKPILIYRYGKFFLFWSDERDMVAYVKTSKDGITWEKKADFEFKDILLNIRPLDMDGKLVINGYSCEDKRNIKSCGIRFYMYDPNGRKFKRLKMMDINFDDFADESGFVYDYHYPNMLNNGALNVTFYNANTEYMYNCTFHKVGSKPSCMTINVDEILKNRAEYKTLFEKGKYTVRFLKAKALGNEVFIAASIKPDSLPHIIQGKNGKIPFRFLLKTNTFMIRLNPELKKVEISPITDIPKFMHRQFLPDIDIRKHKDKPIIAVAWKDYRNVYTKPYISVSLDAGKTWIKDIPIVKESSTNMSSDLSYVKLIGDKLYVYYFMKKHVGDEGKTEYRLELVGLEAPDLLDVKKNNRLKLSDREKEELLLEALKNYENALKSNDEKRLYDSFDPFFKRLNPFEIWKHTRIKVKFLEAKLVDYVYVKGTNLAKAYFKVKAQQPKVILGKFKVDEKNRIKDTFFDFYWVFIGGKWYQVTMKLDGFYLEW